MPAAGVGSIMATYRVYIRRPTTTPPIWDWAETVVASRPDVALGWAYANWVNSKPQAPVPPLSQCQSQVNPVTAVLSRMAASAPVSPAQQAFMAALQDQVTRMLSTQLDGAFSPVVYPAGFNYGITYGPNAYYNQATLEDIDTLLGVGSTGQLELTGAGFSNLYAQIMQAVTFSFSQQDQATMNRQDTAASAQVASILTEFTNAGGTFSNPLPLGGKLQDVFDQLTAQFGSLDKLPPSLNSLRNAITAYQAMAADSYALHNRWWAATARIQAALQNATKPSASNGGQQVSATDYYVGYTPSKLPSANALLGALATSSNALKVALDLSKFTSTSSQLQVAGGSSFEIPIADVLGISLGGSASYDLSRYASSQTSLTMEMVYPGVTLFASTPSVLSADNKTGWYANDILQEVAAKTGQDATGYKLQGSEFDVNELFGRGKAFSRLKTFVISQQPTITLTFTGADVSRVTSDLKVGASLKVSLLGLFTLGSASGSYAVQKVDADSSAGTVTVTFGPPQVSGTIPLQQQVAYVLGGVASYPPNDV